MISVIVYAMEDKNIFQKLWIPIGITNLIHKKNDFIVRTISNVSIIIRNDGQSIRAFKNQCSHRGSQLFTVERGSSPLVCPFHAWSYHDNGKLKRIPLIERYGFSESDCEKIKLTEYSTKVIGKIIFINLDKNPLRIEDQLDDDIIKVVEEISNNLDINTSLVQLKINADWKLMMDITKDSLHPRFVHRESFVFSGDKLDDNDYYEERKELIYNDLKNLSSFWKKNGDTNQKEEAWFKNVSRYGSEGAYYDLFIFPNFHMFSGDGGYSFGYTIYFPNSDNYTIADYAYTHGAKIKNDRTLHIVHQKAIGIGLKVFKEDIQMMENVSTSLKYNKDFQESFK